MYWSNYDSKLRRRTSVQFGRILLTCCLIACILSVGVVVEAIAQTVDDIMTQPGVDAIEYYVHHNDVGWNMNTVTDIAFGEGGAFGNDLYFMDNSLVSRGRLYRLTDMNGDGDASDPGESSFIQYPYGRRPHAMVFGNGEGSFGTDLFLVDDGLNQIYRLNNFSPAYYPPFAYGFYTPSEAEFTPDGSSLLILETRNFTVYGAGADGLIYILDQFGNSHIWANGGNIPHGLWDINTQTAMSPDGWLTFLDHSIIRGSYLRQLVQFRDNNSDGDANDSGEGRVIIPTGSSGTLRSGIAIDNNGNIYIGAAGGGTEKILKFEDLNSDGDFWDSTVADFDTDEMSVFADNMPGIVFSLGFAPDGELFAGTTNWWDWNPRKGVIVRFTAGGDADGDGVPDDQDVCPGGDDNLDADGDSVPDFCDPCPNDAANDADGDGVCGDVDTCPGGDDNQNADGDALPDFCDVCPIDPENDADGDGICESDDNCPLTSNENQSDIDEDNRGDVCDDDIDGDSVLNEDDNCPYDVNTEQTDADGDGAGDICDADDDNDGVLDADDACVPTPLGEVVNADGCSISELCPCTHPIYGDKWKNHGAYVRAVAQTAEDFVSAGLITEVEKDAIVSEAARSSCGSKN